MSPAATDQPCAACKRLKSLPQDMSNLTSELRLKYRLIISEHVCGALNHRVRIYRSYPHGSLPFAAQTLF